MISYFATGRIYQSWLVELITRANIATDALWMLLVGGEYTPDYSKHASLGQISDEVSGSGYKRSRLSGVRIEKTEIGAWVKADDVAFEAKDGSWKARRWVLSDNSIGSGALIACGFLQEGAQDLEITDGNELVIKLSETGIFKLE